MFRYSIFIIIGLISFSCKTTKNISTVREKTSDFVMPDLYSTINVHYKLHKEAIKDTFNLLIDDFLAEDMQLKAMGMDVAISKTEAASIEFLGRQVLTTLPVSIGLSKKTIINNINAGGSLELNFVTTMDMDSSWNLVTRTSLEHYEWVEEPELSLGVFKLSIGSLANNIIDKSKAEFESQIDKSINEQLSYKDKILDLLKVAEKPILLDTIIGSWFSFKPSRVFMSDIYNAEHWASGNITVQGKTHISETKPDVIPGIKLPTFKWETELDKNSSVNLVLDISYEHINNYINANYGGKTFSGDGKNITLHNFKLESSGEKLAVIADVSGSFNGQIMLLGQPVYDNDNQVFYTDDIEVNVSTNNVFHKAGAWLLKSKIKNQLKQVLRFSIKDNIETVSEQLKTQAKTYNVDGEIEFDVDLNAINIDRFVVDVDRIHTFVNINMQLQSKVYDVKAFNRGSTMFKLKK